MLVIILTALDFIAAILMLLLHFHISLGVLTVAFALYLIIKGLVFVRDIASVIDIVIGLYMLFLFIGISTPLTYVFFAFILIKLVLTIIAIS